MAYRVYTTDAAMMIAENTAKIVAGRILTARWIEVIEPVPTDTRTAVEIADDFIQRHGLKFA